MNFKNMLLKALITIGLLAGASTSWAFKKDIALQGFLKNASGPLSMTSGFNYRVILKKGTTAVWGKDYTNEAISAGVLSKTLTGVGDDLTSAGYSNFGAVNVGDVFDGSGATDTFSALVIVDLDNNGLSGSDASYAVNLSAVPLAITANSVATTAALPAAQITGTIGTTQIAAAAVTNAKLATDAADTAQIKDGAVTSSKLAAGAVDAAAIASGAVGSSALATGAVASAALGAGAVDATALGTDAVTTVKIQNGAVTSAKLAAGAVDATAIGTDAVITAKIMDANVTTAKIADANITTAKFATGAVDTAALGATSVTAAKMAASSVDLATSVVTNQLPLSKGGSGANLTASNGAIAYSDASALALLAPGTSGQVLRTNGAGAPSWMTLPVSTRSSQTLFEDFMVVPVGAVNTSVVVGTAAWSSLTAGGTLASAAAAAAGTNGVARLATGTTAAANAYLGFCGTSATGGLPTLSTRFEAAEPWSMEVRLSASAVAAANGTIRIGMMGATGSATAGAVTGSYIEITTTTATAQSRATGLTTGGTTSTIAAATYNRWGVSYDGAGVVSFSKDGTVFTTINVAANIPTATPLCPYVNTVGGTTTRNVDVDYISFTQTTANRP